METKEAMTDASERERLIAEMDHQSDPNCTDVVECADARAIRDMLRAAAETIRTLTRDLESGFMQDAYARLKSLQDRERECYELRETIAAQSAELAAVRKDAERYRWIRSSDRTNDELLGILHYAIEAMDKRIDAALAAQSSANRGGEGHG